MLIDPLGAISLVARQLHRPSHRVFVMIYYLLVSAIEQGFECGRLVSLPRREMEVKRMTMFIAKQVNLGGKPATGAT